jgi:splicing factor 3B subunit 1
MAFDYTIPPQLAEELEREDRREAAVELEDVRQQNGRDEYKQRKYRRAGEASLERDGYKELMKVRGLEREEERVRRVLSEALGEQAGGPGEPPAPPAPPRQRKRRWDVTPEEWAAAAASAATATGVATGVDTGAAAGVDTGAAAGAATVAPRVPVVDGIALTDDVLDKIIPRGYQIAPLPAGYQDGVASGADTAYYVPPTAAAASDRAKLANNGILDMDGMQGVEYFKEEDAKYFGKLSVAGAGAGAASTSSTDTFMALLLKVKNGTPAARKKLLRQITAQARQFGAKTIFDQVLPLLLEPRLDDQERHVLVKLVGRVLGELGELVRPYTHRILVVVAPMLIDEDWQTRLELRELVLALARAAGFSNMISNLRPDLDHVDEFVRNTTLRVLAVVAHTLGLAQMLPFLRAVVRLRSWTARHTGIKVVQQLCVLLGGGGGVGILPYLAALVRALAPGLDDEALAVRTISAMAVLQLAESVQPYGIEAFEVVLEPVWRGLRHHRGKGLAAFVRALGALVPLMAHDPNYEEYANYYTREVVRVVAREFALPDDEMRRAVLHVLARLPLLPQTVPDYATAVVEPFFKHYWTRRVALDVAPVWRGVVAATAHLARQLDAMAVLEHVVAATKDANENLRRMGVDAVHKVVTLEDGLLGLSSALEVQLVDGVLFAFQEQTVQLRVYLQLLGAVCGALGARLKPHLNSIVSTVLYRVQNKLSEVRQQAFELVAVLAPAIRACEPTDDLLLKLVLILYESLGEVYPEVLALILAAMHACLSQLEPAAWHTMQNPSVNHLLPTLTPILKNRHDRVQEACVRLVGLIARKNAELISAKEWMRVCFELLDMLKSPRKRIRVAANDTFGHIARTIGPQDVLAMLLNNLRVQERQLRVCTAVAIGIVADTCAPFTVLPALMNEYRIPDNNVQNGVLKAMSFLFEYLAGDVTRDYLYAITPLIEDALTDRDLVHRQTAATIVQKVAINCVGTTTAEQYDVFVHYLNLVMPNIYETSPHVITRILESLDAVRAAVGVGVFANYVWAGLFHPARKVRAPFWKLYNRAYIQSSDTLVPCYPDWSNIHGRSYEIAEMNLIL